MQTSASAELLDQPPARWVNLALQRLVLPEVIFGRGIGLISLNYIWQGARQTGTG